MTKTKILIVEDEAVISMHIQNSLIKLGYEVCCCVTSGEESIRLASELKPDLILMDIVLQGSMDGIEAARIIKDTTGIPVVYMTGNADVQTITRARETDPYGYVLKPINVLHLFSTIDTVLHRNELERSLRESDEKLRNIIENSMDGIILVDEKGAVIEWNAGMERNTGFLKSEVAGRPIWDVQFELQDKSLEKKYSREFLRNMYNKILGGHVSEMTNRYIDGKIQHRNGSTVMVEDLLLQLPTRMGTTICIFQRDVTERKLAEEALREKTDELDRFFNLSIDLLCIADTDGYFRRLNHSWETTLGYRLADLEGKRFFDFIHPDDIAGTNDAVMELSKGRDVIDFTNRYRCKDGSYRWIEWRSTPFQEKLIYAAARDITERKRIEEALRKSEEKFRSLSDSSPMGVFYTDSAGDVLYTNKSFQDITGISYEKSLGHGWIKAVHPDDSRKVKDIWEKTKKRKIGGGLEWRFVTPEGDTRWVYTKVAPIFSDDGKFKGFVGTNENITDRKFAEEALRESEERFRSITTNLPGVVYQFYARENGEMGLYYVDERSLELFNINNKPIENYFERFTLNIHPDDRNSFMESIRDVVRSAKDWDWEGRYINPRGHEMWLRGMSHPTRRATELVYNGLMLDITDRKIVELRLRESEEKFRALVDNLQDIVVVLDAAGTIKFENPSAAKILGYSLMGRNVFEIMHPEDIGTVKNDFMEVIGKKNPHTPTLVRIPHQDGSWLYIDVLATNLFDNSIIRGMMAVGHNVTERIEAQKALVESEQRYRALFSQSPVGVFLFDSDLIIKECNDRFSEIVHSNRDQIIGFDSKNQKEQSVVPKMREAIKGNTSFWEGWFHIPYSEETVFHSVHYSPLRDAEGNVKGGIAVVNDLTDRKKAEEKLKVSEERNRLLVENANESIAVLQERRFVFTNPQFTEFTGYSRNELASRDFTEFVHHDDRAIIEERYRKRMGGDQTPFTYELRFISREGATKWVELNSVLFTWEEKPSVLLFIRDIAERKQAEEERRRIESQIQQTQKLESLGVLAGGIAHDFNNLLMAILGNIDLALLDLTPSSPVRMNLLEAAKASQRAADLCRQMLAYSGRGKFKSESLNLNEIIQDMSHMLDVSVSKKAILRYNYATGLPPIEADATQMRQIIMNLVINASDAIGEKSGIISISTGMMDCDRSYLSETWLNDKLPEGQYVCLEVADTGCGMDRDMIPKIFDPFFTTKFTGRGLAAVFGIVRGHRGAIKVYSEKGRGTTFKILMPASEGTAEQLEGIHINGKEWRGSGTILLADDEETIRTLGRRMLERLGFTVLTAANGREVLDLFQRHEGEIACIILDLTMPHMDGEEAFRELRRADKNVRVIMSSGYNEQEITQRFAGKPIAGFIQKPYQVADLAAKLKEVLG
jgi:PAS domain S-box-containing protein